MSDGNDSGAAYNKVKETHRKLTEQMWLLERSLPYINQEGAYEKVKEVVDFFRDTVLRHFEWEEHKVFPVALTVGDLDIKAIVRELQQQHIIIISKFDVISDIIVKHGFQLDEETRERFAETSREMLNAVLQHADKEDKELYPFLEEKNIPLSFDS